MDHKEQNVDCHYKKYAVLCRNILCLFIGSNKSKLVLLYEVYEYGFLVHVAWYVTDKDLLSGLT